MHPLLTSSRSALLPTGFIALSLALAGAVQAQSVQLPQLPVPTVMKQATLTGHVPPSTMLSMSMSLQPRNRAAMTTYANRVNDPKSSDYHRFLTPTQIGERFGPSMDTVNAAVSFLKSKKMTVTLVAGNRMGILFKGRADSVESAFSTKLNTYRANGRTDRGPSRFMSFTTTPKVPAKVASQIVSIGGLQTAYRPIGRSTLTPSQTRQLYNAATLYGASPTGGHKGEGVNVGITNYDGYRLSNLPLLYSTFGLPTPTGGVGSNVTKVPTIAGDGETAGAVGEGDLDIQLVLAVAPKCNLYIYDAGATTDYVGDYVSVQIKEADDDIVDIVSESYGFPTDSSTRSIIVAAHDQHLAMSIQGITYLLATGDYGTDLLGNDYPNFDPEILQVGGSVATVDGQGNRISEVGWDGSGAGWSTFDIEFNVLPGYLVGSSVPTNINRRIFPDVALHAFGGTGEAYNFVFDGVVSSVSGTSASSPTFAGELALILQQLSEDDAADLSPSGRPRMGRLNDLIYTLDGDPSVFVDLSGGDAGQLPNGDQATGKPGWDFVTGWGAPDVDGLLTALLLNSSIAVSDEPTDIVVYHPSSPNIAFGTNVQGGVEALPTADGIAYSVQSVKQTGVGQVAASVVGFDLTGDPAKRRGLDLKVTFSSPSLTTGYVYLRNVQTGNYDVFKTVTGSGAMKSVTLSRVDIAKYVNGSSVDIMVRAIKPTRLGSTAFRLSIDQTIAIERLSR
jgi:hypothetical protein